MKRSPWMDAVLMRWKAVPKLLLCLLLLAWLNGLAMTTCSDRGADSVVPVLLTLTLCLLGWANHARLGTIRCRRDVMQWLASLCADLLILLAAVSACWALLAPKMVCLNPPGRFQVAMVFAHDLQRMIAERAQSAGSLKNAGDQLAMPRHERIAGSAVTSDGKILVVFDNPQAVLTLIPSLDAGAVVWHCDARPATYMAVLCQQS